MAQTIISILTPVRNAEPRIERTLLSLHGQSAVQSGRCRLEHLVLDGASSDNTPGVAARFPGSQCLSEPDRGMYDALAKGLPRVTGDIVGYLNAGDMLFPWAFDVLLDVFSDERTQWACGYSSLVNERGQVTASWKPPRFRREFVANGFYADPEYPHAIQQESTFWRRALIGKVDLAKLGRCRLAGDYFLWTEFARHVELDSVMALLGAFLVHDGQLSGDRPAYRAEALSFARKASGRERLTRWWETGCPPLFRGFLWNWTLGKSPARVFEYQHMGKCWTPR